MATMRAKMVLNGIINRYPEVGGVTQETLVFNAVSKSSYTDDGLDEDNTFAKFSPSGRLEITVANPALIGKLTVGDKYYVDFTKVQ